MCFAADAEANYRQGWSPKPFALANTGKCLPAISPPISPRTFSSQSRLLKSNRLGADCIVGTPSLFSLVPLINPFHEFNVTQVATLPLFGQTSV
jgi:hypothetical protein